MQDKVYIQLPPVVKFGLSPKRSETNQMGHIIHHASHITQHILHMDLKFYKNLRIMMNVVFDNS